jgi:hypothetical protein
MRIEDLQSHSTSRTPLEEREGRERKMMTKITNVKKLEEDCIKLCKKSA